MRSGFQRLALVALVALLSVTAMSKLAACSNGDRSYETQPAGDGSALFDETFDLRSGGDLVVDFRSADLEVRTRDGEGARVRVEARGSRGAEAFERSQFSATGDGDRLLLATEQDRRGMTRGSFQVIVEAPRDMSVTIDVGSGEVEITDIEGELVVDTGSGDVEGGSVGGDVQIETGSGEVEVGTVGGRVAVSTGSGDIDLTTLGKDPVSLRTGSGEIELTLEKGAGFDLAISTGSGEIESDRDLDFSGSVRERDAGGTIGGGGADLRVRTGSGDVSIRTR